VKHWEIRADYDRDTIIVYQAFGQDIARAALAHQRFVAPFSFTRMTWIKPSYLWLMERSNWGHRAGQEHILAVRITRRGWEEALSQGVLTTPETGVYRDHEDWQRQFAAAHVHVQWDPERSLRGASVGHACIQVGLSRHIIERYVNEWIVEIRDYTGLTRKLDTLIRTGHAGKARDLLPPERVYPVSVATAHRLGMKA